MHFFDKFNDVKSNFEKHFFDFADNFVTIDDKLTKSINYSLHLPGKRLRPVLMLLTSEVLTLDESNVMPFAIALELIHTYSLIHDDLPSMDNDDFRRGQPTNHKVFGEDMAILAGDAILNKAYEVLFRNVNSHYSLNACRLLSMYAGAFGMVGGQALDIQSNELEKSEELLYKIHDNKCGKLITASVLIPACLSGDIYFAELKKYGEYLGLLFQITDDILDVTSSKETLGKSIGKDEALNKLTFVTYYGLDGAKNLAKETYDKCVSQIKNIENSQYLNDLATYVLTRKF
jgi:geranylgeranyl diphosphate synthase type II